MSVKFSVVRLTLDRQDAIQQAAALLFESFRDRINAWPDLDSAVREVQDSLGKDRLSYIALDAEGTVVGWIGGIEQYGGMVWELHPLVVREGDRGRGIGRSLVRYLENSVRERGAITLWVGTDDDLGQTSLAGVDLYPNVAANIANIRNQHRHPYEFYQKCGFAIMGVMPDANGFGKPDIFMAKRVAETDSPAAKPSRCEQEM